MTTLQAPPVITKRFSLKRLNLIRFLHMRMTAKHGQGSSILTVTNNEVLWTYKERNSQ